jgi:hypothetical protein
MVNGLSNSQSSDKVVGFAVRLLFLIQSCLVAARVPFGSHFDPKMESGGLKNKKAASKAAVHGYRLTGMK